MRRSQQEDLWQRMEGVKDSLPELQHFMPWTHLPEVSSTEARSQRCQSLIETWDAGRDFTFNLFLQRGDGRLRIQVGCDVANVGSLRVFEKVAFSFEGIQPNMGEVDPPPEALERGWRGKGDTVGCAMILGDLDGLDWPDSIARHLHFES